MQSFRYTYLTHCWGTNRYSINTITSNIRQRNSRIPWSIFPTSYKYIITFPRWLGRRYLWIDSLCVIQNDTANWLKEAAMMGSVCAGSYKTIAAIGVENNQASHFVDRIWQPLWCCVPKMMMRA